MTTIADKLGAIKNCKADIASAIEAKGIPVAGASFSDYASLIGQIASSAGSDRIFQCTLASREPVDLASSLPFPLVIDGHTVSDQESVLLLGQPSGNNGLYQYTIDGEAGSLIRLEDAIQTQNLVFITSGSFIRHVFSNATDLDSYVDISAGMAAPPLATTEVAGLVKPDGSTVTVDADGTIHAVARGTDIPVFNGEVTGTVPVATDGYTNSKVLSDAGKWLNLVHDAYEPEEPYSPYPVRFDLLADALLLRTSYASEDYFGVVKPDNTTITVKDGVLSAVSDSGSPDLTGYATQAWVEGKAYATEEWCGNSFEQFATRDYVDGYGFVISSDVTDVVAQSLRSPISSKGVYTALQGKAEANHTHTGEEVKTALGYAPVKPPAFVDTFTSQTALFDITIEPDEPDIDIPVDNPLGYELTLDVNENTVYSCKKLSSLTLSSLPDSHLETLIYFSTGMTFNQIDVTGEYQTIGKLTVEPEKSYVLSILNKVLVIGEITKASA